jgi:hypothetical protein
MKARTKEELFINNGYSKVLPCLSLTKEAGKQPAAPRILF